MLLGDVHEPSPARASSKAEWLPAHLYNRCDKVDRCTFGVCEFKTTIGKELEIRACYDEVIAHYFVVGSTCSAMTDIGHI